MSRVFASERNRFLLANIKCDIVALRISQNKHQNRMTCWMNAIDDLWDTKNGRWLCPFTAPSIQYHFHRVKSLKCAYANRRPRVEERSNECRTHDAYAVFCPGGILFGGQISDDLLNIHWHFYVIYMIYELASVRGSVVCFLVFHRGIFFSFLLSLAAPARSQMALIHGTNCKLEYQTQRDGPWRASYASEDKSVKCWVCVFD